MNSSTKSLINLFQINSNLIHNSFKDITNTLARKDIGNANNFIQIAIHILDARYYLAEILRIKSDFRFKQFFSEFSNLADIDPLPKIEEIQKETSKMSDLITTTLSNFGGSDFQKKTEQHFPYVEKNIFGATLFLIQHDAYHLGQLGYIRKLLGLESMQYS